MSETNLGLFYSYLCIYVCVCICVCVCDNLFIIHEGFSGTPQNILRFSRKQYSTLQFKELFMATLLKTETNVIVVFCVYNSM
jgi:hypothetical protein